MTSLIHKILARNAGIHAFLAMGTKARNKGSHAHVTLPALLLITVQQRDQESVCCFEAKQLYFLLSRDQVRLFYQMLNDTHSMMTRSEPLSQNEKASYDRDEETLHEKICFVPHSAHSPFPAYVELSALCFELSNDELTVLIIEVMFLVQDMEVRNPTDDISGGLIASPHLTRPSL